VLAYRLLGYENRAIADRDFRNDTVDAGERSCSRMSCTRSSPLHRTPARFSELELPSIGTL
jgi:hypothetical protein